MSAEGAVIGLGVAVLMFGLLTIAGAFYAALMDGIRDGEWGLLIFISVALGVPALGAIIGAVVA